MSDLVGNPEDRFSRVEAHINVEDSLHTKVCVMCEQREHDCLRVSDQVCSD